MAADPASRPLAAGPDSKPVSLHLSRVQAEAAEALLLEPREYAAWHFAFMQSTAIRKMRAASADPNPRDFGMLAASSAAAYGLQTVKRAVLRTARSDRSLYTICTRPLRRIDPW
jgi:hypothetical protein